MQDSTIHSYFQNSMFQADAKVFTHVYSLIKSLDALLQVKNNQAYDAPAVHSCIFSSKPDLGWVTETKTMKIRSGQITAGSVVPLSEF